MTTLTSCGQLRLDAKPFDRREYFRLRMDRGDGARPILRECNSPLENVLDAACFPLVPYVNRIRGGRFTFRGREVRLEPNMPGDPSPLHGQGWLNPWTRRRAERREAVLSFHHAAGEWPWDYEARQEFALDESGLSLDADLPQPSAEPMPCGLGLHPYFPCGPETRLDTGVDCAWTVNDRCCRSTKVPADGRYDLRDRVVCGQGLDNGFGGWGGRRGMSDPGWPYDLRLSSPQAHFFQLYSPPSPAAFSSPSR